MTNRVKYATVRRYRDVGFNEEETMPVKKAILLNKTKSLLSRIVSRLNPFKK